MASPSEIGLICTNLANYGAPPCNSYSSINQMKLDLFAPTSSDESLTFLAPPCRAISRVSPSSTVIPLYCLVTSPRLVVQSPSHLIYHHFPVTKLDSVTSYHIIFPCIFHYTCIALCLWIKSNCSMVGEISPYQLVSHVEQLNHVKPLCFTVKSQLNWCFHALNHLSRPISQPHHVSKSFLTM